MPWPMDVDDEEDSILEESGDDSKDDPEEIRNLKARRREFHQPQAPRLSVRAVSDSVLPP